MRLIEREIVCLETRIANIDFSVNYFLDYYMTMSERTFDCWRAVVSTHAAVTDRVQRALAAADLPPLSWFELLWAVQRSEQGHPRMSELAAQLTLSRGGITKLVDRLQEAGYITRVACPEDRRSLRAQLTPAGERMLEEMHAVYAEEIDRHLGALSCEQAGQIRAGLETIMSSTCERSLRAEALVAEA